MKSSEFRANIAGFIDGAHSLVQTVVNVLEKGNEPSPDPKQPRKVEVPPALFEQLVEAQERLQRVSEWLISPHNNSLER